MIQFHRRLRPIKVISFDLDDTLYDNRPIMQRAEQALVDHLHTNFPQTRSLSIEQWAELRNTLASKDALLAGNMTALRMASLEHGLHQTGVNAATIKRASEDAMAHFLSVRNQIEVTPDVIKLLDALASRFPLVAISNGNADIGQFGLQPYFTSAWQPTTKLRGKPTTDMFIAAQQALGFKPSELLHIGDHPISDVQGAARFGAQSVWLNESGQPNSDLTWLPTVTIQKLPLLSDIV